MRLLKNSSYLLLGLSILLGGGCGSLTGKTIDEHLKENFKRKGAMPTIREAREGQHGEGATADSEAAAGTGRVLPYVPLAPTGSLSTAPSLPQAESKVRGRRKGGLGGEIFDVSELKEAPAQSNARAVGRFSSPKGNCTATLVAEGVAMLNDHCIPDNNNIAGAVIDFGYESGGVADRFVCDKLIARDAALDAALVRCQPKDGKLPGEKHGVVTLTDEACASKNFYTIAHPNGGQKMVSTGVETQVGYGFVNFSDKSPVKTILAHTSELSPGSSGSLLFCADTHKAVGLNNAIAGAFTATRMKYVIPFLKAHVQQGDAPKISSKYPSTSVYRKVVENSTHNANPNAALASNDGVRYASKPSEAARAVGHFRNLEIFERVATDGESSRVETNENCTATLVSADVVILNRHCIKGSVKGAQVFFEHHSKEYGEGVTCSELLMIDEELDIAMLKCEGEPGKRYGAVKLSARDPREGERITSVHHTGSGPKKVDSGNVKDPRQEGIAADVIHENDEMGPGSSGSLGLGSQGEGLMLNWGGMRGYVAANRMSTVLAKIKEKAPKVYDRLNITN